MKKGLEALSCKTRGAHVEEEGALEEGSTKVMLKDVKIVVGNVGESDW